MKTMPSFQKAIMLLEQFWSDRGCLIWHPHNSQVGAGTMNPATALRVLTSREHGARAALRIRDAALLPNRLLESQPPRRSRHTRLSRPALRARSRGTGAATPRFCRHRHRFWLR